jgi:hypothetical protein
VKRIYKYDLCEKDENKIKELNEMIKNDLRGKDNVNVM